MREVTRDAIVYFESAPIRLACTLHAAHLITELRETIQKLAHIKRQLDEARSALATERAMGRDRP